jgi:hypothetical protein
VSTHVLPDDGQAVAALAVSVHSLALTHDSCPRVALASVHPSAQPHATESLTFTHAAFKKMHLCE